VLSVSCPLITHDRSATADVILDRTSSDVCDRDRADIDNDGDQSPEPTTLVKRTRFAQIRADKSNRVVYVANCWCVILWYAVHSIVKWIFWGILWSCLQERHLISGHSQVQFCRGDAVRNVSMTCVASSTAVCATRLPSLSDRSLSSR